MAIQLAAELDVSPWEALLSEVRRSAARVAWLDAHLEDAAERFEQVRGLVRATDINDESIPRYGLPKPVYDLLDESRKERRHYAVVAKAAIDAGVAERLLRNVQAETTLVFASLAAAFGQLNLSDEERHRALDAARAKLVAQAPALPAGPSTTT